MTGSEVKPCTETGPILTYDQRCGYQNLSCCPSSMDKAVHLCPKTQARIGHGQKTGKRVRQTRNGVYSYFVFWRDKTIDIEINGKSFHNIKQMQTKIIICKNIVYDWFSRYNF